MGGARRVQRKLGYNLKSRERDRRPTLDELGKVLTHYQAMQARRPTVINMLKVVGFALFSVRRLDEITRIRWSDVDEPGQRVLVRDMKNPGQEIGNDVWCYLPDEAWYILQTMPKADDDIFPYSPESISTTFAMKVSAGYLRWTGTFRVSRACRGIGIGTRSEGTRIYEAGGDAYEGWAWLKAVIQS